MRLVENESALHASGVRTCFCWRHWIPALIFGAAIIAPKPVHADATYNASAGSCDQTASSAVECNSLVVPSAPLQGQGVAFAHAGPSGLGNYADAIANLGWNEGTYLQGPTTNAGAVLTLDDVVITSTDPNAQAQSIDASLNLSMHFTAFALTAGLTSPVDTVHGTYLWDQTISVLASEDLTLSGGDNSNGFYVSGHLAFGKRVRRVNGQSISDIDTTYTDERTGFFAGLTDQQLIAGAIVQSDSFTLSVGTPITLQLSAGASAGIGIYTYFIGTCDSCSAAGSVALDASDTFGFPTDRPVFNLPDGFTANSASGLIVNNRWVGPASSTVPEPATIALVGIGLAGLGLGRRRRAG